MKRPAAQHWTYKGVDVFRADLNSSGIRWYARTSIGILRADNKASMRMMISDIAPWWRKAKPDEVAS